MDSYREAKYENYDEKYRSSLTLYNTLNSNWEEEVYTELYTEEARRGRVCVENRSSETEGGLEEQ
jgi:hypothetical protein